MERTCALLQQVADCHKGGVASMEGVALIASVFTTIALLEREIGRRLTNSLSPLEQLHRERK